MLLRLDEQEAAYLDWRLLVSDMDNPTAVKIRDEIRAVYPELPEYKLTLPDWEALA